MLPRKMLSLALLFSLLSVFALATVPAAHADYLMEFDSVVSSCDSGAYTVSVSTPAGSSPLMAGSPYAVRVEVWDSDGTMLGEDTFGAGYGGTYSGTVNYSQTAEGPVTFYLYYSYNSLPAVSGAAQVKEVLADVEEAPADCILLPGCDVSVSLPSTAVVGRFTSTAAVYWEPGDVIPGLLIEAGKTYYVIGQDATEQYYQVLLGCDFVWVLKSTVGPNFDEVWQGKPLPTAIVN